MDVLFFDKIIRSNFPTFVTESSNHRYFAMSCTEVLDKLNKMELIGMVLSLQSKTAEKNNLI